MNLIKNGALLLLIILIAGLILCSFLGGNCNKEGFTLSDNIVQLNSGVSVDASSNSMSTNVIPSGGMYDNYDHYSGTSGPLIYYGPNGGSAKFTQNSDGTYTITVLSGTGQTTTYTTNVPSTTSSNTSSSNTTSSSTSPTSTTSTSATTNPTFASSISSIMSQVANQTFYGPNGGSARLFTASNGQYAIEETQPNGNTTIYTAANTYTYNYNNNQQSSSGTSNPGTGTTGYGYSAYPYSDFSAAGPTFAGTSNQYNNQYYNNSLPPGIPYQMIPPGQEDLYILKSEVVPPVCPACPTSTACPRKEKCPPCPACARCPEPSFECKKVPNYNAINDNYLPTPVLSDFSSFGM
jgi:hypothetical protein